MTAYTTPDGIRYPDDPAQPGDSIAAFTQLANDVQLALNTKTDTGHRHDPLDSYIRTGTITIAGPIDPGESKESANTGYRAADAHIQLQPRGTTRVIATPTSIVSTTFKVTVRNVSAGASGDVVIDWISFPRNP